MDKMILTEPTRLLLPSDSEEVKRFLTYQDKQVQFQVSRMKRNFRWKASDPEKYIEQMNKLKEETKQCLIQYENGQAYTFSGLWKDLHNRFGWEVENRIEYPVEPRDIPWKTPPKYDLRYYQENAVNALLAARHAAISLPTGSGKSAVISSICKRNPVKTVIMAPLASIAEQLYQQFLSQFGKKYVGKFGDGKKESDKLFTVAVAQSLTRIEKGSKAWTDFQKVDQFISDESHTVPADTFEAVCSDLLKNAPNRFFVSATQLRSDGSELLLKGITGPIVYSKGFRDLVDEGFLANPIFKIFKVPCTYGVGRKDAKEETRLQLYRNPSVNALAAKIAAQMVNSLNLQVIILIDEFKQFELLKNYLTVPFSFAHGGATADHKEFLPEEYWKPDNEQIVKDFNSGKIRCLIGTSAISTGVDLLPVGCVIYLQGGTSEIKVKQGIGRGTRLVEGKKDFYVVDFLVEGSPTMERHLAERKEIYECMGPVTEH
jgi:DNA repair protein RadD